MSNDGELSIQDLIRELRGVQTSVGRLVGRLEAIEYALRLEQDRAQLKRWGDLLHSSTPPVHPAGHP